MLKNILDNKIKIIKYFDSYIVLDVPSGSIHLFNRETKETLIKYLNGEDYNESVFSSIKILIDEGTLLPSEDQTFESPDYDLKSICLNVSHTCNLACPYCFAKGGNYSGKEELMNLEVGKKSIDFLLLNSGSRKIIEVDFFGGEPLLNFELIKELVSYGENLQKKYSKVIKWSMTTNGVLLSDEVGDYLIKHNVGTVLSLDGRKETHDRNRYFPDGRGSFCKVINNINNFTKKTEDYVIRGTFTKDNLDFYNDLKFLVDSGFKHISLEPVVSDGLGENDLTLSDLPNISKSYDVLMDYYLNKHDEGKPFDFFHFNINILGGPCRSKRLTGCGAGFEYIAITPKGEIYPCHQLIQNREYKLGDIFSDTLDEEVSNKFKKTNIFTKKSCPDCWARYFCSGGCNANNINFSSGINSPYNVSCEIAKDRIEKALFTQVYLHLNEHVKIKGNDAITKDKIKEYLKE